MGNGERDNATKASRLSQAKKDWDRQYDDAMQWRDWMTCEMLLKEREESEWFKVDQGEPDLCVCGPKTRAEWGCECSAIDDYLEKQIGGHPEYRKVLGERMALHVEKSSGYGNDDDAFANFTAVASLTGQPRYLYPVHRTIEKLTRVLSLHAQGRTDELEEEFKDCASLLDCATAMLRVDGSKTS